MGSRRARCSSRITSPWRVASPWAAFSFSTTATSFDLQERQADSRAQRILLSRRLQRACPCVASKDHNVSRVLIGHQQPLIPWIQRKMARAFPPAAHMLHQLERAILIVDFENGYAVVTAVGGIDEPPRGVDRHLCRRVFSLEALRQRADVLDPA